MVDARQIDSGTLAWYVQWLGGRNPEWTEEQRLEIATGFVAAQLPPERPTLDELMEENQASDAEERKQERRDRRYLTGKELMEILQTPGAVPKVSGN